MMIEKLGLQLWTVRDFFGNAQEAANTFRKMVEAGYTQAHTAGNYGFTPDEFGKLAADNGVEIIGTHYDLNAILNDPEETIRVHKLWGTTNIGVGGGRGRDDVKELRQFVADYNRAAELYAKEGFKLTYHNHNWEFHKVDGVKTIMDILAEELDPNNISFVLDTCWVQAGCANVIEWMEKLAGRIDILHLKDVMVTKELAPIMTEVGNGFVPWDMVMDTAEKIGVQYYVVEQDANFATGDPFDSIRISADYLKKYR